MVAHQLASASNNPSPLNLIAKNSCISRNACPLLVFDPDLAAVVDAWRDLPEAVRTDIVAIVKAALTLG